MRPSLIIAVACKGKNVRVVIIMSQARFSITATALDQRLPCGRPLQKISEYSSCAPDRRAADDLLHRLTGKLNDFVREKKLKKSESREKILAVIVREARHFTALDLLERLGKSYPDVGKATVYRNLPVFVASRIIKEGPPDVDGHVLYELADGHHHDHIVCLDCRRIFEFHDEAIEKRQELVSDQLGFVPREHRHIIYAKCSYRSR